MAATAGTESTEEKKKSQTYPGGCHCGYIRFEVTLSPPLDEQTVVDCNCSMCRRGGYLLVYPLHEEVHWVGESHARCGVYRFNTKVKEQLFCPRCGVSLGLDFKTSPDWPNGYGISVRTLDNIDLHSLKYRKNDGSRVAPAGQDLSTYEYLEE